MERANHSATPCAVEKKDEGGARRDESKEENRVWTGTDDMNNDDDRDRPQMADDDADGSQALAGGDITKYRARVARISDLSQDHDLKFASVQVC